MVRLALDYRQECMAAAVGLGRPAGRGHSWLVGLWGALGCSPLGGDLFCSGVQGTERAHSAQPNSQGMKEKEDEEEEEEEKEKSTP